MGIDRHLVCRGGFQTRPYGRMPPDPPNSADANSAVFDNSRIKRLVPDFRCEVNWAEGVRRSIQWHAAHPEFQTRDTEMTAIWDTIIAAYTKALP